MSAPKRNKGGKRSEKYPNFDQNCCYDTELWKGPFTPLHYKGIYVSTWTS